MLAISSVWGGWDGAATAPVSALAFNFSHIPPTGRLTIAEGENRVALAVLALRDGERQLGTLLTPAGLPAGVDERLRTRVIPSLEALLAAALAREALQDEVVETAALRRSAVLKTALLGASRTTCARR